MYAGDIRLGDTIDIKFTTRQVSGAPTTLAGTPVVSAYPGNSTTQLTAGITLSVDFDAVTGLNNVRVVATSGNGYATATNYTLVITTGTVNSVSVVGEVIGSFSIEARSALMPTVAARTLDVSAGGEGGVDWANVGTPGSTVSLSATTVATVTTTATATAVTTVNGLAANVITATAIATGALTAAKFAAGAFDAVWTVAARILTAATNITSTGGTTVPQTGDSYAVVNSVTHGNAALKTLIDAIDDFLDTEIAAILAAVDTEVAAIKVQTDKLTFNATNQLTSDLRRINNTAVAGDGGSIPWGP
jgi:hypothetical protein